jgi:hypothetical protein
MSHARDVAPPQAIIIINPTHRLQQQLQQPLQPPLQQPPPIPRHLGA